MSMTKGGRCAAARPAGAVARWALAVTWLCAAPAGAVPQDARALPGFAVTSAAGALVPSSRLLSGPNRVLVYVTAGTASASSLVDALAAWHLEPAAGGRIAVIVAGPADQVATLMAAAAKVPAGLVTWFADPDGQAGTSLGTTGAVTVFGGRDGAVHWTVGGVLNDPAAYEQVVRAWLGAPAAR